MEPDEVTLIMQFLDLESSQEKINFLQRFRSELTERFLNVAAESLGYVETGDTFDMRFNGLIKCLNMKNRYETGRLR